MCAHATSACTHVHKLRLKLQIFPHTLVCLRERHVEWCLNITNDTWEVLLRYTVKNMDVSKLEDKQ